MARHDDESFELLKPLGAGGFAHTHKARVIDKELIDEYGTDVVALKIPLDKKKARVLRREVEMNVIVFVRLKQLRSSNLARYLGFETFEGTIVMVMEYVEGGSLRNRIGSIGHQKSLPVDEAIHITKGVLHGLAALHREHVFHRDISPENILLDGSVPKVSDFGISRMLDSNEMASTTSGKLFYMSPEILSPQGASFTSDIWSLGVTVYEMLTGRLPFGDRNTDPGTMVDLIRQSTPKPVREFCADIPGLLGEIVTRALEKDPGRRYQSAEEMLTALEEAERKTGDALDRELALLQETMNNIALAANVESKLIALMKQYPADARVRQHLGEFYNRCQRHAEAIKAFLEGLRIDPGNALLHWDLALAYQRQGKRHEAIVSVERAITLGLDPSVSRQAQLFLRSLRRR